MTPFLGEFLGTAVVAALGSAVALNARLPRTEGTGMGWAAIAAGWGAAFAAGMFVSGHSGAQLNSALTIAAWMVERVSAHDAWVRLAGQAAGTLSGIALAWAAFLPHWSRAPESGAAALRHVPGIDAPASNLLASAVATGVLVFVLLRLSVGAPFAGAEEPAAEGILPGARTPFMATNPGEASLLSGVALAVVLLGFGGTGAAVDPVSAACGRLAVTLLPSPSKPRLRPADAVRALLGPALGALLAAAAWRASVS